MNAYHGIWKPLCCFFFVAVASSPALPSLLAQSLDGWSRIELRLGVGVRTNSGVTVSSDGVETSTKASGLVGAIGYSRWVRENLAVTAGVGVQSVQAEVSVGASGVDNRTALVIPLLVGIRGYLATSESASGPRLFGSVEAGPIVGQESSSRVGAVIVSESFSRTAVGGRLGVGLDIRLGSKAMLGALVGYNVQSDFSEAVGGQKNHSGPEFSLGIGVVFGGSPAG